MGVKRKQSDSRGTFRGHLSTSEYEKVKRAMSILEELRDEENHKRRVAERRDTNPSGSRHEILHKTIHENKTVSNTASVGSSEGISEDSSLSKNFKEQGRGSGRIHALNKPFSAPHIFSTSSRGLDDIRGVNCIYCVLFRECDVAGGESPCKLKDAKVLVLQDSALSNSVYKFTLFRRPRSLRDIIEWTFNRLMNHFNFKKPRLREYVRASCKCEEKFNASRQSCGKDVYNNLHIIIATIDLVEIPEEKVAAGSKFYRFVTFGDLLNGEVELGLNGHILMEELWTLFG